MATQAGDTQPRKAGIGVGGDVPWGTDTLVPHFRAGLETGEFCIWVEAEPLTEARNALREAVPEFDRYLADRSLEIVRGRQFHFSGNDPVLGRVTYFGP